MAAQNMGCGYLSLQEKQSKLRAFHSKLDSVTESSLYSLLVSSPIKPSKRKRSEPTDVFAAPDLLPSTDLTRVFDDFDFEDVIFNGGNYTI